MVGRQNSSSLIRLKTFRVLNFRGLCAEVGVTIIDKGVEAHWSFGSGEGFHKSLRETWDKCALESRNRNLSADAVLSLVVFSLNAVPDSSGRSSSLMVFGQVPRPLASKRSNDHEWEQMTTRDRHALQILAREAAELATAKNWLHEINRRARSTDLTPYVPGELCYVFSRKGWFPRRQTWFCWPFCLPLARRDHVLDIVRTTTATVPSVSCQVRHSGLETSTPGCNCIWCRNGIQAAPTKVTASELTGGRPC
jgi:hypothetical protein